MSIKERLAKIVGSKNVADGVGERYVYSFDMTENPPNQPALVVMPSSVEEIQEIIRFANGIFRPAPQLSMAQMLGQGGQATQMRRPGH